MYLTRQIRDCLSLFFTILTIASASQAVEIIDLGTLPSGNYSYAFGVSNNLVVTGEADNTSLDFAAGPFRYSSGVMAGLDLLSGDTYGSGLGISHDGSVIVGVTGTSDNINRGFRYSSGVITSLNQLAGDVGSQANGVSGNGSVVVGRSYKNVANGEYWAVRWNGTTPTALGELQAGYWSEAHAASFDGSTIVGYAGTENGDMPFVWTVESGMTALTQANGYDSGSAFGVSADGSRIAGYSFSLDSGLERSTIWIDGVPLVIGSEAEGASFAFGVSADGFLVVGSSTPEISQSATIWNADSGQSFGLKTVLEQLNATGIGNWDFLAEARAVSGNSLTGYNIVGWGQIGGADRAFLVTGLIPVPEPSSWVLGFMATGLIVWKSLRRKT